MGKRKRGRGQPLHYRRFATAAEAIRFAVEELPSMRALGAWMQVGDKRFDGETFNAFMRATISHCNGVCRSDRELTVNSL